MTTDMLTDQRRTTRSAACGTFTGTDALSVTTIQAGSEAAVRV
jgi:hypothetical protein